MKLDEALKAAARGYKVAPMCKKGFFVYHSQNGFRRVIVSKHAGFSTYWDEEFIPSPFEKMMVWEIYSKNPLALITNFLKRVFGKDKVALTDPA